MKQTKLSKFPRDLPDDVEVRDFDLGGGKYARVIMEVSRITDHGGVDHLVLTGQAYEMTKAGEFKSAPLGYPSRSASSSISTIASGIGKTIELDNAWVQTSEDFTPVGQSEVPTVSTKPTEPGTEFGQRVWVESEQRLYKWAEGIADTLARTKVEDLLNVLKTSDLRSGFAFRNRRNKE